MKFNFQNYQQLQIDSESYKIPLAGTVRLVHHRGMSLATSYTPSNIGKITAFIKVYKLESVCNYKNKVLPRASMKYKMRTNDFK